MSAPRGAGEVSRALGGHAIITPYRDGPYLVRGSFRLLQPDGTEIAPGRRTIALCRCGKSQIRPLCDGTHRAIGFRAPGQVDDLEPQHARAELVIRAPRMVPE